MAAVSETIVREYFEQRGFLVYQPRKYVAAHLSEEQEIDFFVVNPQPKGGGGPLPFVLGSDDVPRLERAVVVVKAWHTEIFSPAVLAKEQDMFRFVDPAALRKAVRFFGGVGAVAKVLVVPTLPQDEEARHQSIELLRGKGLDAILLFRTLLAELVASTEPNRNYQKSDLLQIIRLLKNYDFLKGPQMELFKPSRAPRKPSARSSPPAASSSSSGEGGGAA